MYAWLARSFTWLGERFTAVPQPNPIPTGYQPFTSPVPEQPVQTRRGRRNCSPWFFLHAIEIVVNVALHAVGTVVPTAILNIAATMQTTLRIQGKTSPADLTLTEIKGALTSAAPFILLSVVTTTYSARNTFRLATFANQYTQLRAHLGYIRYRSTALKATGWYLLLLALIGGCALDGGLINTGPLQIQARQWRAFDTILTNGTLQDASYLAEATHYARDISLWTFLMMNTLANAIDMSLFGLYIASYFFMLDADLRDQRAVGHQIQSIHRLERQLDGMAPLQLRLAMLNTGTFFSEQFLREVQSNPMLLSPVLPRESVHRRSIVSRQRREGAQPSREPQGESVRRRRSSAGTQGEAARSRDSARSAFPLTISSPPEVRDDSSSFDEAMSPAELHLDLPANRYVERTQQMFGDLLDEAHLMRGIGSVFAGAAAYQTFVGTNISIQNAVKHPPIHGYDRFLRLIGCSATDLGMIEVWNFVSFIKTAVSAGKGTFAALESARNTRREIKRTGTFFNTQTAYFTLTLGAGLFTALPGLVISRAYLGTDPFATILAFALGYFSSFPSMLAVAGKVMRSSRKTAAKISNRAYQPSLEEELRESLREIWTEWIKELEKARRERNLNRALAEASTTLKDKLQEGKFAVIYARLLEEEARSVAPESAVAFTLRPEPTAV